MWIGFLSHFARAEFPLWNVVQQGQAAEQVRIFSHLFAVCKLWADASAIFPRSRYIAPLSPDNGGSCGVESSFAQIKKMRFVFYFCKRNSRISFEPLGLATSA
jgi:hypothetical protein